MFFSTHMVAKPAQNFCFKNRKNNFSPQKNQTNFFWIFFSPTTDSNGPRSPHPLGTPNFCGQCQLESKPWTPRASNDLPSNFSSACTSPVPQETERNVPAAQHMQAFAPPTLRCGDCPGCLAHCHGHKLSSAIYPIVTFDV